MRFRCLSWKSFISRFQWRKNHKLELWKVTVLKFRVFFRFVEGLAFCFVTILASVLVSEEEILSCCVLGASSSLEGMMAVTQSKESKSGMDPGKYVRYTPEQVEALERLYHDCPKPSSIRRQQLIRECPILSHIEPKQIKVWFQNRRYRRKNLHFAWLQTHCFIDRFFWVTLHFKNLYFSSFRCREKQRKEASRLQAVNRKLSAMNKLLMEENDRLQKQVSQLVYENGYFRQQTQNVCDICYLFFFFYFI